MSNRTTNTMTCVVALLAMLLTSRAIGQYDLPPNQQDGTSDCGPAAAGSCLKDLKDNGFGDLKDADGDSGVKDFESQLETDAKTDANGTWIRNLRNAINKLIDATDEKGKLCAAMPKSGTAYKGFDFLDGKMAEGCRIMLLLMWKDADDNLVHHYVAVRNITGTGASRTVSYMDPATGTNKSGAMAVNAGDSRLHLNHGGTDARVGGILVICPKNGVSTTATPVDEDDPSKGTNIGYTVYYPSTRPTRDLHVWVGDCDQTKYTVTGLPAGWQWKVEQVGNRCYISFWKGASANEIPSGNTITVKYTGNKKVRNCSKVVTPTTGGTASPTNNARPPQSGHTVAFEPGEYEPGPTDAAMAIVAANPEDLVVAMQWQGVPDLGAGHYEIYDVNTGYQVAETTDTQVIFDGLEHDGAHEFIVAARYETLTLSEFSDPVSVLFDLGGLVDLGPGETTYVPSLYSSDLPRPMIINTPGGNPTVQMAIATHTGGLLPPPPLPPAIGSMHGEAYSLWTTNALDGPIFLGVPYDQWQVEGNEQNLRMLALDGAAQWQDVTQFVDPAFGMIFGQLPGPTVLAIFNQPVDECPPDTNGDGVVDVDDLINVILCWGSDGQHCPGPGVFSDVDGDGLVTVDDLIEVILSMGLDCVEGEGGTGDDAL